MTMDSFPENTKIAVVGDWSVAVTVGERRAELRVSPPEVVTVVSETILPLPEFNPNAGGWLKGARLKGVTAQECSVTGALDASSLVVKPVAAQAPAWERGKDYEVDLDWGTVGRLVGGRIRADDAVVVSYRYAKMRLDSVVLKRDGSVVLIAGAPDVGRPLPPELGPGQTRLANIFLAGFVTGLSADCLYPVLETVYPETEAAVVVGLTKTMAKLRSGAALKILAWGDSVTDAGYLPEKEAGRWQEQFVSRLRRRYPSARIDLVTEAWGGRNTDSYLAEPAGSPHNFAEKVLGARPDLIISEFVNDAGLNGAQVEERYGGLLAKFGDIGAEWIILTPHYVRPDWMGLTRFRDVDDDPRLYVQALRAFGVAHGVSVADASHRWGRLWRQGLPYLTMLHNNINHPDFRGMALFADSLMPLFR
jgi:hypothetical protein